MKNTAKQDTNICGSIVDECKYAEIWQREVSKQDSCSLWCEPMT
jgi:hypothetical protein